MKLRLIALSTLLLGLAWLALLAPAGEAHQAAAQAPSSTLVAPSASAPQATHSVYLPLVAHQAATLRPPSAQELIAAALEAGQIDYGTSLLYRAYAFFGDTRLPDAFIGAGSGGEDVGLFVEAEAAYATLPPDVQARLRPFMVRPDHPDSIFSAQLAPVADAPVETALVQDSLFCDSRGWAARASLRYPVTVHAKCFDHDDPVASADISKTLQLIEGIWGPMTALMGAPKLDAGGAEGSGDTHIDLYLIFPLDKDVLPGGRDLIIPPRALAAAAPAPPYVGVTSSAYLLLNRDDLTHPEFRTTLIHEFFHVLQYAHNQKINFRCPLSAECKRLEVFWFTEASAEWAAAHFAPETARLFVHPKFVNTFQPSRESLHRSAPQDGPLGYRMTAAYIWPYFMEQENGTSNAWTIGATWYALEAARDWDQANTAIDRQLPFGRHFHTFALRNFNDELLPGDPLPITQRHVALDPTFPDKQRPPVLKQHLHTGQNPTDPPFRTAVALPALTAGYFYYKVDDANTQQVHFGFSALVPPGGLDIDAFVKIKDKPWTLRSFTGRNTVTFCFDKPEERLEEIYLVLSNHYKDFSNNITGDLLVRVLKEPCGCYETADVLQRVTPQGWTGSFTFSYDQSGYYQDPMHPDETDRATVRRSATYTARLDRGPFDYHKWVGQSAWGSYVSGSGSIDDVWISTAGRTSNTYSTIGSGNLTNFYAKLDFDLSTCTYDLDTWWAVGAVDSTTGPTEVGSGVVLYDIPIPALSASSASLTVSGSRQVPLRLGMGDQRIDQFSNGWTRAESTLESIYYWNGETTVGYGNVTWSLSAAVSPAP